MPLPNENLIEEDVPFARTNVAGGPVVDSVAAPYYPGVRYLINSGFQHIGQLFG